MDSATRHLILITIGPVQEFIAQARKTRDLWFGSHLLSRLGYAAAKSLEENGVELIFPYVRNVSSEQKAKVTNKLLGIAEAGQDPRELARHVQADVLKAWKELSDAALHLVAPYVNVNLWERQVKDFLEFYAVWSALPDDHSYGAVLERSEQLMAARKTLRDFRQNDPACMYGDKKSSLNGGRESVILANHRNKLTRFGIKTHETLDAISMVKRLSFHLPGDSPRFPSVCETAFLHYERKLAANEGMSARVRNYYNVVSAAHRDKIHFEPQGSYDFRLFYENRIEDYVEEHAKISLDQPTKDRIVSSIVKELQELYKETNGIKVSRPASYYAFVVCDGDRMGRYIRGLENPAKHRSFSEHLSRFANTAGDIISRYDGELVYSGGDDVMAYLPLHHFLAACRDLQEAFVNIMKAAIPEADHQPTLSVGVAVVHMMEMLGNVRELAMEAERLAKRNRDSLAIIYRKRSGGDQMKISLPFANDPVGTLQRLQRYYRNGLFPSTLAYDLRRLYTEYSAMKAHTSWLREPERFRLLILQEVERIVRKKKPEHPTNQQTEMLNGELLPLFERLLGQAENALEGLRLLAEQLVITVNLVKAGSFDEAIVANTSG